MIKLLDCKIARARKAKKGSKRGNVHRPRVRRDAKTYLNSRLPRIRGTSTPWITTGEVVPAWLADKTHGKTFKNCKYLVDGGPVLCEEDEEGSGDGDGNQNGAGGRDEPGDGNRNGSPRSPGADDDPDENTGSGLGDGGDDGGGNGSNASGGENEGINEAQALGLSKGKARRMPFDESNEDEYFAD